VTEQQLLNARADIAADSIESAALLLVSDHLWQENIRIVGTLMDSRLSNRIKHAKAVVKLLEDVPRETEQLSQALLDVTIELGVMYLQALAEKQL